MRWSGLGRRLARCRTVSQGQWKIRLRRSRSSNLFQGPRTRWVRMHWMRQVVGKYLCDVTSDWMRLTVPQRSVFYVKLDPYYIACCTMCLTQFIEYCEDTQYIPIPPRKPGKQSARPTNHHYSNLSVWGFSAAGCCRKRSQQSRSKWFADWSAFEGLDVGYLGPIFPKPGVSVGLWHLFADQLGWLISGVFLGRHTPVPDRSCLGNGHEMHQFLNNP